MQLHQLRWDYIQKLPRTKVKSKMVKMYDTTVVDIKRQI